jgi:hypothetical protein
VSAQDIDDVGEFRATFGLAYGRDETFAIAARRQRPRMAVYGDGSSRRPPHSGRSLRHSSHRRCAGDQLGDARGLLAEVIELEDDWIGLAAIDARVTTELVEYLCIQSSMPRQLGGV